jgi:hypothetical protein
MRARAALELGATVPPFGREEEDGFGDAVEELHSSVTSRPRSAAVKFCAVGSVPSRRRPVNDIVRPYDAPLLLGRYQPRTLIARGGSSMVFEGIDETLGRNVASRSSAPTPT